MKMKKQTANGFQAVVGLLCGLVLCGPKMHTQTMSPTISEFNRQARGVVHLVNTSDATRLVSCRAQGFDPNEHGSPRSKPLDPKLNVRIATSRELLAPNGTRQISFEATPAALPAWFLISCRFMPAERGAGITVATELNSVVIVHGGNLDIRDVRLTAKREGSKVQVEVNNDGAGLARVDSIEIVGHRKKAGVGTFLLFPHQRRLAEADWNSSEPPQTVRIHIGNKHLEAPVN
jgi:hypothetical protein